MHFHFQQEMKIKVSMRWSPHRATVHRTVAFDCSNPSPKTKRPTPKGVGLFVAVLNLMYILQWVFGSVQDEKPLNCNGFQLWSIHEMVGFCV